MPSKILAYILIAGVSMGSVWLYGKARYNEGVNAEKALCVVLNAKAGQQAHKDWEKISEKLEDTSKDDDLEYLRSLGNVVRD